MTEQFSNNDLQTLWDTQPEGLTVPNMKELTMSLQHEHRKEQKRLLLLNVQELLPAAAMFLWLGWEGLQATDRAWAWFLASAISLGIALFLAGTSLRQRRVEQGIASDTAQGEIERSLSQMQHRAWLYRNVAWWYVLPAAAAVVLILVGSGVDFVAPATLIYLAVGAAFSAFVYRLNRNIGRTKYEPQIERLTGLLAQLTN